MTRRPGPATRAVRAGLGHAGAGSAPVVAPPSLSSVRAYRSLEALDRGMVEERGLYRRHGNESVELLEAALSDLEAVEGEPAPLCRVTASGQAAMLLALLTLVTPARTRIVVVRPCYGATESLVAGPLAALGARLSTVDLPPPGTVEGQAALVEAALGDDVAAVVAEVVGNPLLGLLDLPALTAACRERGVPTVIDSTFCTPFLLRPLEHGADVVVHSLTKHLSGHSDVLGGAVLARAGTDAAERLDATCRIAGAVMSPFDAWLCLRGLRTAGLRIERGSANAALLARALAGLERVVTVHYPGLRSDAEERLAQRLLPDGRGPMLTVDTGSRAAAEATLEVLSEIALAPSLGDVATTVSHPALTSHRSLGPEERAALGIGEGLLRFSVGCEDPDDLRDELEAALGGR